jgi:hypothetical protein
MERGMPVRSNGKNRKWAWAMPSHTLHVVQAFEEREGGIVPVEPKACPSAGSARALAARLAQTHVGVIAWSRRAI